MVGHIYDINCDCCSYKMVLKRRPRWMLGPRCQGCGAILGWMQWTYLGSATGADDREILANYERDRKAALAAKQRKEPD